MSKIVGNVDRSARIIRDNGADILRMWVASTDYFEDVRIGKEVLAGTSDAYRKLRNTFRYLLGALGDFSPRSASAVPRCRSWSAGCCTGWRSWTRSSRPAAEGFEFNRYSRAITTFANDDLSAFFFDIRKDSLYCDAPGSAKRRAYRTVLDTVFHALSAG
jgi:isoleucyl-tRNA synthetase